ncbi:uncharacterized protein V6R79_016032 [Siganus canaliculatus]
MKGRCRKAVKRKLEKKPAETLAPDTTSSQATQESNTVAGNDFTIVTQATAVSPKVTPRRGRGRPRRIQQDCLTSTPVHSSSTDRLPNISESPPIANQAELECPDLLTPTKTPESKCQRRRGRRRGACHASQPKEVRRRLTKTEQASSEASSTLTKGWKSKKQKIQTNSTNTESLICSRPRFEPQEPDAAEQDEPLLSSDLSIELSDHGDRLPNLPIHEDEESDDEEELPSFLMQANKKPMAITEGAFVWYKIRNYPFWPAWVKSVNRKQRKASISFVDDSNLKKGFTVPLRNLKPFDGEEYDELVCKAKENHHAAIEWSLDLISDYRIRIACGSFSGSFNEYFAHDMSYPVRKKYPKDTSQRLTIASDSFLEALDDSYKDDSSGEQQEEIRRDSKRLLPDRSHAAHNRANEKLVHFIVNQRMVEERLLAVIHGQQQSRWLRSFQSGRRRRVVNTYLEDEHQLDQVYRYLKELYLTAKANTTCSTEGRFMENVPFVLDVLLPEAIICAIAGVDNISVKEAEEKYLKGRCISNREIQEFHLMIEQQMRQRSQQQNSVLLSV